MDRDSLRGGTQITPHELPDPGRERYLPERIYFGPASTLAPDLLFAVTARSIAAWADRYLAYSLLKKGKEMREGRLPEDGPTRDALLDELFRWLGEQTGNEWHLACITLFDGEELLLNQLDGPPGTLALSEDEFELIQATWERAGLPRDLYYRSGEQRTAAAPSERYGGLVLSDRSYTPREWALRDPAALEWLRAPGEEHRVEAFVEACETFHFAALRRFHELQEHGRERDEGEIRELLRMSREALEAASRARHGLASASTEQARDGRVEP